LSRESWCPTCIARICDPNVTIFMATRLLTFSTKRINLKDRTLDRDGSLVRGERSGTKSGFAIQGDDKAIYGHLLANLPIAVKR
jgi:hypothetical protein